MLSLHDVETDLRKEAKKVSAIDSLNHMALADFVGPVGVRKRSEDEEN